MSWIGEVQGTAEGVTGPPDRSRDRNKDRDTGSRKGQPTAVAASGGLKVAP